MRFRTRARALHSEIECERWKGCSPTVSIESREGVHDRYSIALATTAGPRARATLERAVHALMRYRIFPKTRMRHSFCPPTEELAVGTTIVQRVLLGPLAVEMAVRIVDVFDHQAEDREIGFTYVTLAGHMERGMATFFLRLSRTNDLTFNIESWSRPGNRLAVLAGPIVRVVQKRFTNEALANFGANRCCGPSKGRYDGEAHANGE